MTFKCTRHFGNLKLELQCVSARVFNNMFLLILATLASFIGVFIPHFIKPIISCLYKESSQEVSLKRDILELEKQLAGFSMVDEFARCARLQRKIVQLKEELSNRANIRRAETMKKKIILSYAAQAVMKKVSLNGNALLGESKPIENGIFLSRSEVFPVRMGVVVLVVMWQYRAEPVIIFPDCMLWPLHTILSWPTGIKGAVSVTAWLFISGTVATKIAANLNT